MAKRLEPWRTVTAATEPGPPAGRGTWGFGFGFTAIRQRLVILYLLATCPLVVLLFIGASLDRSSALRIAQERVESVARLGAQQQDEMLQEAQNLLNVVSLVPDVRLGTSQCHSILRTIDERHQRIINLSVYRLSGEAFCNSRQEHANTRVLDRAYFQDALAAPPGEFVISDIVASRQSGRPTLVVARAFRDDIPGLPPVVIGAALNLDWFSGLSHRISGSSDTFVEIVDTWTGTIVTQSRDTDAGGGPVAADNALLDAIRSAPGGGSIQTMQGSGATTVGFVPLPGTNRRLVLSVSLPDTKILAPSTLSLTTNVLGFIALTVATLVLAWLAADRSLLRPIGQLASVASRIGTGELVTRVGPLPGAVKELQILGENFNSMAERLRARDDRIAAMGRKIAESEEHHRLLADNSGDMIGRFDHDFTREYVSAACREVLGFEPEELVGRPVDKIVLAEDLARMRVELVGPLLNGAETARSTYRVMHRSGKIIWVETFGRRLSDGSGFVTVARDVTLQKALETRLEAANQQLRIQVMTDPLTGIANRRRFDEMLGFEFRRAQRLQEPLSLLMVDIDHFKLFNDSFGHSVGDECLRAVATALDRALRRPGDLVGRYGGEEFAIVLPGTSHAGAMTVAERVREAVSRIALHDGAAASKPLTVSIGGATIMPPICVSGPAILLETADAVLYEAKNDGRNRANFALVPSMPEEAPVQPTFV